jgi:hypothetical protein
VAIAVYKSEDGYSIRGMEPPDIRNYHGAGLMFWGWVLELGLRAKDKDLSQGIGADGKPLRPISERTRKNRRSTMTPSGKGDPNAPPLIPGWQKSRVWSLLTGRAFDDHVEFWWKFDAWTGDSFARILDFQATVGRDVFGLSPAAVRRVKAQSWARWESWKAGRYKEKPPKATKEFVIRGGKRTLDYLDVMGHAEELAKGGHAGFRTWEQWQAYLRGTAAAVLPGRAARPVAKPVAGAQYNRLLAIIYGQSG